MDARKSLLPKDSFLLPQSGSKGRSRMAMLVAGILILHGIVVSGLLIHGCKDGSKRESVGGSARVSRETNSRNYSLKEGAAAKRDTNPRAVGRAHSVAKIGTAYGISTDEFADAKPGMDTARLKVGQVVQVSKATTVISPPSASKEGVKTGTVVYVVKAGDTLSKIARSHRTSVQALQQANGLRSDLLLVGQKIKIPSGVGAVATVH